MGVFFVYMLKASVCLAVFYLFYRLLLSKETFHRFNRLALLGVLVLSCLVPFMEVTTHEVSEVSQPFLSLEELLLVTEPSPVMDEASMPFPWRALVLLIYWVGILFFLGRHLWSLGNMLRLLHVSRKERLENRITLFVHEVKEVAPFSWMKNIVISKNDLEENGDAILTHERAHIRNRHSWDLLLAEGCIFFQWFNPAAWLLKQELQTIHEYEADEWVIENGIDAKTYQLLIIKKAVGARLYSIANSFNHSSLKKRITMMIKKKSNPWARLKYLYVLPLTAIAVVAFARPEVSNEFAEISSVKVNDLTSIVKMDEVKSVENSLDEKFKLSGQVMDYNSKKPVPGATVIIKGTSMGAMTDKEGRFTLSVKKGDVLVVSYVGLQTQILPIEVEANLVVWMRDDVQSMDEMIVTAMAPEEKEKPVNKEESKAAPQEGVIFQVVEEMPEFPGGMGEAMKFLGRNIKYPVVAQQAKIEGRVIVQFVVERDGNLSNIHVVRGVSPELDAEAIRVIGLMPKWKPGKQRGKEVAVKYTVPIMFRLQTPEPEKEEADSFQQISLRVDPGSDSDNVDLVKNRLKHRNTETEVHGVEGKSPLVVVDGEVKGNGADILSQVSVADIQSITVLKNESAMAEFGDKAKDGAILITTKKKEN